MISSGTNESSTDRYRPSGSNISVTIPNLVRQMRISVFNYVSVAERQTFRKETCDGQNSASKAHSPPNTHQLTQSVRQGYRRNQASDAYPITRITKADYYVRFSPPYPPGSITMKNDSDTRHVNIPSPIHIQYKYGWANV